MPGVGHCPFPLPGEADSPDGGLDLLSELSCGCLRRMREIAFEALPEPKQGSSRLKGGREFELRPWRPRDWFVVHLTGLAYLRASP